jgi:hypothetical protein
MPTLSDPSRTELAHRSSEDMDVTLLWVRGDGEDKAVVCVCDRRDGAYFEISAEPRLALDVLPRLRLQRLELDPLPRLASPRSPKWSITTEWGMR